MPPRWRRGRNKAATHHSALVWPAGESGNSPAHEWRRKIGESGVRRGKEHVDRSVPHSPLSTAKMDVVINQALGVLDVRVSVAAGASSETKACKIW